LQIADRFISRAPVQKFYNKALAGGQKDYAKLYASILLVFFTRLSS